MAAVRFLVGLFTRAPSKRRLVHALRLDGRSGDGEITSGDGTPISVRRTGEGEAVLIVHGTLDGISSHAFVEVELAQRYSVWVYDRRGRGASGDHAEYSLDREVEDLEAVIGRIGDAPHVIGHSFGAVVALLAAQRGVSMRSLTLYEPPVNGAAIPAPVIDEIRAAVGADRRDDAIRSMAFGLAGISDEEVAVALAVPPVRKRLRDGVATAARELEAIQRHRWDPTVVADVPTMVLRGERTSAAVYPTAEQAAALAEDIRVAELPGQGHLAHVFAPYEWVDVVTEFLGR